MFPPEKKCKKPLDKSLKVWYNKGTDGGEVERTTSYKKAEIQQGRNFGNVRLLEKVGSTPTTAPEKVLDKPPKLWYNKGNTTEMADKTRNKTLPSA